MGANRATTAAEDFDLKGYGTDQAKELVLKAFSTPFPRKDMCRITFLIGGGKEVRQKYRSALLCAWIYRV